jgi:hypothetical protein
MGRADKIAKMIRDFSLSELLDLKLAIEELIEKRQEAGETDTAKTASEPGRTRRLEYARCGKVNCRACAEGPGHGPYLREYWREDGRLRSRHLGKPK